ncbi:MAG: DNA/RNA nuclease SfsA [Cyanobacteria bacterium P01_F01_bin.33]
MVASSPSELVFTYPPLIPGILKKRYKRFLADIELASGELVTAHCPNTGPMTGVCEVDAPVMLSHHPTGKRKLPYTWELIRVDDAWVGVNTARPNRIVELGLAEGWFPELIGFETCQREAPYGEQNSRIDFLLTYPDGALVYVEVKNTTWCDGPTALFPDTVTTRGQKHLQELMLMVERGHRAVMLYFIHRGDCTHFAPGDRKDPDYGRLLRQAAEVGVEILPYRFHLDPPELCCLGLVALSL